MFTFKTLALSLMSYEKWSLNAEIIWALFKWLKCLLPRKSDEKWNNRCGTLDRRVFCKGVVLSGNTFSIFTSKLKTNWNHLWDGDYWSFLTQKFSQGIQTNIYSPWSVTMCSWEPLSHPLPDEKVKQNKKKPCQKADVGEQF